MPSSGGSGGKGRNRGFNWSSAAKASMSQALVAREHDTVSWMIGRAQKTPLLTHDESTELFKVYMAGSKLIEGGDDAGRRVATTPEAKRAREKLVAANMKLVISIAKGYRRAGIDFEDLLQEGNMGLMKAIEKFDWELGYRFSTYATWWIRQAVTQFIMKRSNTVRLPAHAIGVSKKMEEARESFKKEFGHDPSVAELSSIMDVSESIVKATVNGRRRAISLSTPLDRDSDDGDTLGDSLADRNPANDPFEAYSQKELFNTMKSGFVRLSPREDQIVRLRFGIGGATEEDNPEFQVTEEEAAEIAKKGQEQER